MAGNKEKYQKRATKLTQAGKYVQAAEELLKIIEETPNDINTLNKIGDLYSRGGKVVDAVKHFQTIATHYTKEGFYAKAIAVYKKITKIDPRNNGAYFHLADLYVKEGIPKEARESLIIAAQNYLERGEMDKAREAYEKILELQPDSLKVRIKLAELYHKQNRKEQAVVEYIKIGEALLEKNLDKEAQSVYEKIARIQPDNMEAVEKLVDIYTRSGENQRAINLYSALLQKNPDNVDILKALGTTYYNINEVKKAGEIIKRVLTKDPDDPETLHIMAKISLQENNINDSCMYYLKVIELKFPNGPDGSTPDMLKPLIEKDPYCLHALEKQLDIYSMLSDTGNTILSYEKLGVAYRHHNMIDKAIEAYEKVLDYSPENKKAQIAISELNKLQLDQIPQSRANKEAIGDDEDIIAIGEVDFGLESTGGEKTTSKPVKSDGLDLSPSTEFKPEHPERPLVKKEEPPVRTPSAKLTTPEEFASKDKDGLKNEEIYEIEILIKYGLLDKAKSRLIPLEQEYPKYVEIKSLLRGIYLEQGDRLNATLKALDIAELQAEISPEDAEEMKQEALKVLREMQQQGEKIPPEVLAMLGEGGVAAEPSRPAQPPAPKPQPEERPAPQPQKAESPEINYERKNKPEPAIAIADIGEDTSGEIEIVDDEDSAPIDYNSKAPSAVQDDFGDDVISVEIPIDDLQADEIDTGSGYNDNVQVDNFIQGAFNEQPSMGAIPADAGYQSNLKIDDLFSAIATDTPAPPARPHHASPQITNDSLQQISMQPAEDDISDDLLLETLGGGIDVSIDASLLGDADISDAFESSVMVGEDKSLIFELEEVDFYLNQDFLEEAKSKLQDLQSRFPDNQGLKERLKVLAEKYAATEIKQLHDEVTDFKDLFEDEETPLPIYDSGGLASEMDAFLEDDAPPQPASINRTLEPIEKASPAVSNANLFDEAQDFFNITSELEDEIFIPSPTTNINLEAQLESIFDEFRDEVNESLSENDYETRYNLGIAYKEMDLLDEAIQEFQAAVKGKTHAVDAASMLGYCFIEKEMPPQAIQWFHKAISSYPQGVIDEKILGLKCALAEAYLLNDDKNQAAQITQEINQINPHFPGLRDLLQRIH